MKLTTIVARLADVVVATSGVVCLLVLSYFLYFYSWTGLRQFRSPSGPYIYYGVPALVTILLFAALKLSRRQRINVALCLCSVSFSIYAVEFLITLWFNLPSAWLRDTTAASIKAAKAQGISFDARTKSEVVNDLRARGLEAVPSMFPGGLIKQQGDGTVISLISNDGVEFLPLGSISHKPTVVCNENGQYLVYSTDEHGFNNPDVLWKDQKAEVVALGDSYTQGWCVGLEENFIDEIRKKHPAILNLGIEGNGPLMELATLREYGQLFKPKVVLWFFYEGNDLADLDNERRSPLLNQYLKTGFSQRLMSRQAEIDSVLTDYIERFKGRNTLLVALEEAWELATHPRRLPKGISGVIILAELRGRLGLVQGQLTTVPSEGRVATDNDNQTIKPLMELLHAILSNAKKSVNEWGGELFFVYLPERERYITAGNPNPHRDRVLKVVAMTGLRLIDMHEVFKAQQDPLALFPFRIGGHYNDHGHSLVAEKVLRSIFGKRSE